MPILAIVIRTMSGVNEYVVLGAKDESKKQNKKKKGAKRSASL